MIDKKILVVFDLDGVLLDSSHRFKTIECRKTGQTKIDLQYWLDNSHKSHLDRVIEKNAAIYREVLQDPERLAVIATARQMNEHNYQEIYKKIGKPDFLIHRTIGDNTTKGAHLKIQGLYNFIQAKLGNQYKHETLLKWAAQYMAVFEDNPEYLTSICAFFNCTGVFIPSKQGY